MARLTYIHACIHTHTHTHTYDVRACADRKENKTSVSRLPGGRSHEKQLYRVILKGVRTHTLAHLSLRLFTQLTAAGSQPSSSCLRDLQKLQTASARGTIFGGAFDASSHSLSLRRFSRRPAQSSRA